MTLGGVQVGINPGTPVVDNERKGPSVTADLYGRKAPADPHCAAPEYPGRNRTETGTPYESVLPGHPGQR